MIKLVLSHAAAVHGLAVRVDQVDLARLALSRLGLVGKGKERDRRPTEEELERLFSRFDGNARLTIPMAQVVQFAIATAMRLEEIFSCTWDDYNPRTRMLTIRDRKDPRNKEGNDQRIPLLKVSGYDAVGTLNLGINAEVRGGKVVDVFLFSTSSHAVGAAASLSASVYYATSSPLGESGSLNGSAGPIGVSRIFNSDGYQGNVYSLGVGVGPGGFSAEDTKTKRISHSYCQP